MGKRSRTDPIFPATKPQQLVLGQEAARIGLVTQAVPKENVLAVAEQLASKIANNCSPVAVRETVATLRFEGCL